MKISLYSKEGKETKQIELSEELFAMKWNADLMHEVVVAMQSNARQPIAHTKDRSEVSGGGKKPWKQKGTGRARHGSNRSPIWRTGGVTFGPRNDKDYSRKINKKVKSKALGMLISQKIRDNEVIFLDDVKIDTPKTKTAKDILLNISKIAGYEKLVTKKRNAGVIGIANKDANLEKSFSNFNNLMVDEVRNLNIVDILKYKYLILENSEEAVKVLSDRIKTN